MLALVTFATAWADAGQLDIKYTRNTGRASLVRAKNGGPIPVAASAALRAPNTPAAFLAEHGRVFGIQAPDQELAISKIDTDPLGHTHSTYEQMYQGIPVFSGMIKVHQDADGRVIAANGRFNPVSAKLDLNPMLDAATAQRIAAATFPNIETQAVNTKLTIVDPGWYGDPPVGARLAYYFVLIDDSLSVEEAFFVDAHSGAILDHWTIKCTLKNRVIYDGRGQSTLPVTTPPVREEGQFPVASPPDANRAYDYYGDTYDFFFRAFGRDSINNAGMDMVATVNWFDPNVCPNAFWSGALQAMVFCNGTITDDIVAHELAHGVTDYTSGLIYQNQSGQLNESLSDIFGETVDLFNGDASVPGALGGTPWPVSLTGPGLDAPNNLRSTSITTCSASPSHPNGVRWLMGEDAFIFGGAIRDMWNPTCFNDPDRANSPLMICNPFDNGGVHSGSGVPNHAFAIMTDGKTFNGQTVVGIGLIKAIAVWYRAQTTYFTPGTDFQDAYDALNLAAADLIGTTPNDPRTGLPSASAFTAFDAQQVDKALIAVEMNSAGRCGQGDDVVFSDPPPPCNNKTIIFFDDFESGVNGWTTSNTSPPTPYNWVQVESLPYGRAGTAWFCEDRNIGNCADQDESAIHSLFSPQITVPAGVQFPALSFTHYMASEAGFDGGNVKVSVNGGPWQAQPRSLFRFNPYNGRLLTAGQRNTNPMAGQEAWTGAGGQWGTSVFVDLSRTIEGGDAVQFRFDFGKDCMVGMAGWYVDDFTLYTCCDCNQDSVPDDVQEHYAAASPVLPKIGDGSPQLFTLSTPPMAQSGSTVDLFFTAQADLDSQPPPQQQQKYLSLRLNSTPLENIYFDFASSCAFNPSRARISVPAATYNSAIGTGDATISIIASSGANSFACYGDSYVTVFVKYEAIVADCNHNGIEDAAEIAANPSLDLCRDGILDVCQPDCSSNSLHVSAIPDVFACVGVPTLPIGPEPLATGGAIPYSYSWSVIQGTLTIADAMVHDAHPTLTPPAIGDYLLKLDVTDSSTTPQTASTTVKLIVGDTPQIKSGIYDAYHPIVTTGDALNPGSQFTVTGGRPPYTYRWTFSGGPAEGAAIQQADSTNPSVTATKAGTYFINLSVSDNAGCNSNSSISFTAAADPPVTLVGNTSGTTGPSTQPATDLCGTSLCGPTSFTSFAGCLIGFGILRRRRR